LVVEGVVTMHLNEEEKAFLQLIRQLPTQERLIYLTHLRALVDKQAPAPAPQKKDD